MKNFPSRSLARAVKHGLLPHRVLLTASSAAMLILSSGIQAQVAPGQNSIDEIAVTGSRIRDVNMSSPVPVTSLNQEELNMFEPGLSFAEQLENLPQFFGNVSSDNIANRVSADVGQSQLNMRGMGGERTLVLLDGSRVVPSDRRSSVSVDYLPTALIRRVDVVTGGASAAYGADALAGVTNFILDRTFTGMKVMARGGMNEFGDGHNNRGSIAYGSDFGERLHLFGSLEFRNNNEYRRGDGNNPYAATWDRSQGYVLNPDWFPGAPAGIPQRLTRDWVYNTNFSPTGLILQAGSALHRHHFTEDGTAIVPYENTAFASVPGQPGTLNSQLGGPNDPQYDLWRRGHPQSFERVGVQQQTAFFGGDFKLSDDTTLWWNALYGRTRNTVVPSSSGASGTGLGHAGLAFMTVYRDNPFLPEAVRQQMVAENRQSFRMDQHGYLDVPWGTMEQPVIVNRMGSFTGGFDMSLRGDWNLRGSWQFGQAQKHNVNRNWERLDRFYLAMDAIDDPDNPGNTICRIQHVQRELARQGRSLEQELHQWARANTSVFRTDSLDINPAVPTPIDYPIAVDSIDGTISNCVPVNMFGNGLQSQAALDYIFPGRNKTGISRQEQHFGEIIATGTLWEGWGPGPIVGAFGATYREERISQRIVDTAIDALGPIYNVTLPDGTVAIRGIAPPIAGSATNLHRFSAQPTFRGGFNVQELFAETNVPLYQAASGPQELNLNVAGRWANYSRAGNFAVWKAGLSFQATEGLRLRGTLSHDIREGSFEELFVQQGRGTNIVDPWNNMETYTTFNQTGGNPDLRAEEARTKVIGFVFQPTALPGFSISADRYIVDLSEAIGTLSEQNIVDQCFQAGALCNRIEFAADGYINLIRASFVNINAAKVSGYDLEMAYRTETNFFQGQSENLSLRFIGGYMDENSSTPLGGNKIEMAGGFLRPKGTLTGMANYTAGDYGVSLQQIWNQSSLRNTQWVQGVDVDSNRVPSVNLTNLVLSWNRQAQGGSWRASLNINNLFDRDPVIAGTVRVGDELGRRYSLGIDYTMN